MHNVTLPPRAVMSAEARDKFSRGEHLTGEEQRLLVFSQPRKWRRANSIPTTDIRSVLRAMRTMKLVENQDRTQYTGHIRQHQQRYETKQRLNDRAGLCSPARTANFDIAQYIADGEARRAVYEGRLAHDAARRARFDAARLAP